MEKTMHKIRNTLLAGAVVVGVGAVASLAAFTPSFAKSGAHELTLQLPGGGSETITYAGDTAPKVTFQTHQIAAAWPAPFFAGWAVPSFVGLDPVIADMNRQFEMLAKLPLLMPQMPDQPLSAAALGNLPAGTSYSMVSQTTPNGVCMRYTEITKAPGDAKPKVVSQSSGNCGTSSSAADQSAVGAKAINVQPMAEPAAFWSL